jgi:hypothetical protein
VDKADGPEGVIFWVLRLDADPQVTDLQVTDRQVADFHVTEPHVVNLPNYRPVKLSN